jgi:hypothetical protein
MPAFRGDLVMLRNGMQVPLLDIDAKSGWPIVEIPGQGLVAIDPVEIQEGWNDD